MTLAALLLLGQAAPPSLILSGDEFVVRALGREVQEPVSRAPSPPAKVTYRKDDAFAVWDSRGLTVRHGSFVYSTRLPELAVTPKLHTREEILAIRADIQAGDKTKEATALSGSRRIGDEVYFLARWEDKAGKPWLEALVKVDLSQAKPKPILVGRFEGFSTASGKVSDQLVLVGGEPSAFVRDGAGPWGIAAFNRLEKKFSVTPLGTGLVRVEVLSSRLVLAVERTTYGKVRIARLDLVTGSRRELAEIDGGPTFVDGEAPPLVRVPTNLGPALRNLETGVQMNLPEKAVVRRTAAGILVWPEGKPEGAALYSPERFLRLASASQAVEEYTKGQTPVKKTPPP